eukprot:c9077_g1_i2.p1 GENE.c9077_g1_i2~~c9077_g1_i2.p1  ORF type:complete len:129 (+),score=33.52 c9077_g1_i2:714-1100(+)
MIHQEGLHLSTRVIRHPYEEIERIEKELIEHEKLTPNAFRENPQVESESVETVLTISTTANSDRSTFVVPSITSDTDGVEMLEVVHDSESDGEVVDGGAIDGDQANGAAVIVVTAVEGDAAVDVVLGG